MGIVDKHWTDGRSDRVTNGFQNILPDGTLFNVRKTTISTYSSVKLSEEVIHVYSYKMRDVQKGKPRKRTSNFDYPHVKYMLP